MACASDLLRDGGDLGATSLLAEERAHAHPIFERGLELLPGVQENGNQPNLTIMELSIVDPRIELVDEEAMPMVRWIKRPSNGIDALVGPRGMARNG